AFIGTHNYDIGVNLAKIAQQMKPKGGKICLQTGGASAANHNERLQGIRDTLGGRSGTEPPGDPLKGENGWTEVAGCPLITNDDSATAVQQLQDILGKYGDLDVYITTGAFTQWSDNAFRQAMDPYKDKLKSGALVFVSADTLSMQMQQLKDGLSDGQVGQRPFDMGRLAMYRLLDLKNGKTLKAGAGASPPLFFCPRIALKKPVSKQFNIIFGIPRSKAIARRFARHPPGARRLSSRASAAAHG